MNVSLAAVIIGGLTLAVPMGGALFAIVRYVIRAETSELRRNSGSTIKDKVEVIVGLAQEAKVSAEVAARMAQKSADMAEKSAEVAAENKAALDVHVAQSSKLIEQGTKDKAAILKRQDEQDHTIATLADAVKIAAQSTPPE
jgi:hypothetical protein